jgi:hypothetical protein
MAILTIDSCILLSIVLFLDGGIFVQLTFEYSAQTVSSFEHILWELPYRSGSLYITSSDIDYSLSAGAKLLQGKRWVSRCEF